MLLCIYTRAQTLYCLSCSSTGEFPSVEEDHATLRADSQGVNTLHGSFQLQPAQRGNGSQHSWVVNTDFNVATTNGLMRTEMMWTIWYSLTVTRSQPSYTDLWVWRLVKCQITAKWFLLLKWQHFEFLKPKGCIPFLGIESRRSCRNQYNLTRVGNIILLSLYVFISWQQVVL